MNVDIVGQAFVDDIRKNQSRAQWIRMWGIYKMIYNTNKQTNK